VDPACSDVGITVRDGRSVQIRAMRPTDEEEFLQAFHRLSEETRYMRFMRLVREPDRERVHEVLASFPAGGGGIVATVPAADGIDIVGSAVYLIGNDPTSCEFAVTVATEFCGVGLAGTLMQRLIGAAKVRGIAEMEGFVLSVNKPMLRLARRLGFDIAPDPDDGTVRICRLRLADA
jgi:RimJ/RimL family protein N-acetyltransferase